MSCSHTTEPVQGGIYKSLAHWHCLDAKGLFRLVCGADAANRTRGKREQRSVVFIASEDPSDEGKE